DARVPGLEGDHDVVGAVRRAVVDQDGLAGAIERVHDRREPPVQLVEGGRLVEDRDDEGVDGDDWDLPPAPRRAGPGAAGTAESTTSPCDGPPLSGFAGRALA